MQSCYDIRKKLKILFECPLLVEAIMFSHVVFFGCTVEHVVFLRHTHIFQMIKSISIAFIPLRSLTSFRINSFEKYGT